jgi:antitoxin component of MazEF toxin-antitoxin module
MVNKIFKTGHSAAVTLSPKILKEIGLKIGDAVKVVIDKDGKTIIISKGKKEDQLPLGLKIRPKIR